MDYYHIRVEMGEGIATQEVCHLQYYDLPTTIILLLEHWTLEHIVSRREVYIMEHQGFSKIGNGTSRCNRLVSYCVTNKSQLKDFGAGCS